MHVDITFVKSYCKFLGHVTLVKTFNLKVGISQSILLDEKYFGISFHDDIVLLIKASLSYFLVFTLLTFKNPLKEQISHTYESLRKR